MSADLDGSNTVLACLKDHTLSGSALRESVARSRYEFGSCSTFAVFPCQHFPGALALAVHNDLLICTIPGKTLDPTAHSAILLQIGGSQQIAPHWVM
jgi:hypothetical protein